MGLGSDAVRIPGVNRAGFVQGGEHRQRGLPFFPRLMSLFTRVGLRVVCTLVLAAVGVASQATAGGSAPILEIPIADDGVEVSATIQPGCLTCFVADVDAIVSKDYMNGARIQLPRGADSSARIDLGLGTSREARTRVGFMVRIHEGGADALEGLAIETRSDDFALATYEGPDAYETQDLGDGRLFLSVRPDRRVERVSLTIDGSADGILDVEVLHAGLVAEAHLPGFLAFSSEGARGAGRVSVDCEGCRVDGSPQMLDGDLSTYAKAYLPAAAGGWVRATVRYQKPLQAGVWVGFVVTSSLDVMAPEVRESLSLTLTDGRSRVARVSGKGIRATVEVDGQVYLWARAPVSVDGAMLQVHQSSSEEVQVAIRGFMAVPTALPVSAFPQDEPAVMAPAAFQAAATVQALTLGAAAPNPFRTTTRVAVSSDGGPVRVDAFDTLGRHVAVVHDGPVPMGGSVRFDAGALRSGVYILRATDSAGAVSQVTVTIAR